MLGFPQLSKKKYLFPIGGGILGKELTFWRIKVEKQEFLPLGLSAGIPLPPYLHPTHHSLSRAKGQGDTFRVY